MLRIGTALAFSALLSAGAFAQDGEFAVDAEGATLRTDDGLLKPVRVGSPPEGSVVAGVRLVQRPGVLEGRDPATGDPVWVAEIEGVDALNRWGSSTGTLITHWWKKDKEKDSWAPIGPGTLRPLSLETGEWGDPLILGEGETQGVEEDEGIAQVIHGDAGTAVLLTTSGEGFHPAQRNLASYRVVYFAPGTTKPAWSRSFKSAASMPNPSWFRADLGGYIRSNVTRLQFARDDVVVCAGPWQDILALATKDGSTRWKVERAWDFEPNTAEAPSRIVRAEPPSPPEETEDESDEDAEPEPKPPGGRILAGPRVVLHHGPDGEWSEEMEEGYRVFFSTGVDHGRLEGYDMTAFLFEFNHKGNPVAGSAIPRPAVSTLGIEDQSAAVFLHEGRGITRVTPSFQKRVGGSKEIGTPHRVHIDFHREPPVFAKPEAWMVTGTAGAPRHLDETCFITVPGGAYLEGRDDKVLRLPVTRIDLNGAAHSWELAVPFTGTVPMPDSNFSAMTRPGQENPGRVEVRGPHLACIVDFELIGTRLEVVLWARGRGYVGLRFELDAKKR